MYRVKILTFNDGERYPILLKEDGLPLYFPTLYISTMVRSGNHAAKTLERHLRAIMHLYTWAQNEGLDIENRLDCHEPLNLYEIDSLVRACRNNHHDISLSSRNPTARQKPCARIVSVEQARAKAPKKKPEVQGDTAANRIRSIRNYVEWLMHKSYNHTSVKGDGVVNLNIAINFWNKAISSRIPQNRKKATATSREGLAPKDIELLLQVLNPNDSFNPWSDKSLATRNQLIFILLYTLGIRRGELLGLKIEDINFQAHEVTVRRRPDDPDDPRTDQPNAKTKDRKLRIEPAVADMVYDYIVKHRSLILKAKRNSFLLVTHKQGPYHGNPLSITGYSKMIETLREKVPTLPDDLSGHIMRHSWNDQFSRYIDQRRKQGDEISQNREEQMREYLMGWKQGSGTASTYTKRHIREKSNEISREIQKKAIEALRNEE
ncbi:site-specific integrase [uncultured Cohaesibacter sp.]|uniref:tyrosine-type recombinase/integrase n=1 Tax=uncultured Cohaesibacter sp. TaxID=1002546 RepID=UPI0029C93214|nr:site-specific integrase [uncultured Cohaesibacter sp.]